MMVDKISDKKAEKVDLKSTNQLIDSLNDERIKFYEIKNKGFISKSRNFGIEKSKGDYIFFTDSDCMVTKNWIEEGMNILVKNEVGGVEGKTVAEHQNFGASQHFVENYETCQLYQQSITDLTEFH